MLISKMIQEEEKENMQHRFLQFENAEVTERIGFLHGKTDIKTIHPKNTQINDLKRQASIRIFSFLVWWQNFQNS